MYLRAQLVQLGMKAALVLAAAAALGAPKKW
jgi:hypothetical protein